MSAKNGQPEIKTIRLSEIIFDEVVYPRRDHDPILVQRYADVIEEIEAAHKYIAVGADMKLLDGKHRWLAYRKRYNGEDREIQVFVYPVTAPHDQLKLAAKLNSDHGWQLTNEDKEQTAKSLYAYGMSYDEIASALSVGKKKVGDWLARTVKDNKERRDRRIFDLWLACHTQQEIVEEIGCPQKTVDDQVKGFSETVLKNQSAKSLADHATDFDPPIYNVWKQQEKTSGSSHFGNSEVRWLDNLLYLYTKPFDVVIDPFAGGGSTIDLCRKRFRRYYVSDRKPIVEREKEIRRHDLVSIVFQSIGLARSAPVEAAISISLPKPPQWKDVRLVYLDPPYWKQAQGEYSDEPSDLANMSIDEFNEALAGIIKGFAKKLSDAYIALIIQPTQWKAPNREFTDHVGDMLRAVRLPVDMRFSVPYESQQCNAQMVEWAKENRRCLVLTREIIVWRTA